MIFKLPTDTDGKRTCACSALFRIFGGRRVHHPISEDRLSLRKYCDFYVGLLGHRGLGTYDTEPRESKTLRPLPATGWEHSCFTLLFTALDQNHRRGSRVQLGLFCVQHLRSPRQAETSWWSGQLPRNYHVPALLTYCLRPSFDDTVLGKEQRNYVTRKVLNIWNSPFDV